MAIYKPYLLQVANDTSTDIQVGVIGLVLELTVQQFGEIVDISSAGVKQYIFKKPVSGTLVTKTATFATDGTDGKLQYVTASTSDLDEAGEWEVQVYLEMSGFIGRSTVLTFTVNANLV